MPVVDLAVRFGYPATTATRRTCIVIVEVGAEGEQQVVGVLVDAVYKVIEIPVQDIEPPSAFGAHLRTEFLQGLGKIEGEFVMLLNGERVLASEEMTLLSHPAPLHDAEPTLTTTHV